MTYGRLQGLPFFICDQLVTIVPADVSVDILTAPQSPHNSRDQ
jgi:hypothetical protein